MVNICNCLPFYFTYIEMYLVIMLRFFVYDMAHLNTNIQKVLVYKFAFVISHRKFINQV